MTHITEDWKPVVGYEGWYEVSSLGRVRRVHAYHPNRVGAILRQNFSTRGYWQVCLSKDNRRRTRTVHALVAEAFIGKRPDAHVVNHVDGNKQNNSTSNLEYITSAANTRHALGFRLSSKGYGTAAFYWRLKQSGINQDSFALALALQRRESP